MTVNTIGVKVRQSAVGLQATDSRNSLFAKVFCHNTTSQVHQQGSDNTHKTNTVLVLVLTALAMV